MNKFLQLSLISVFALLLGVDCGYAYEKSGQDCSKCHNLSQSQALEALKVLIPDIQVLDVIQSPVAGFWEVSFKARGQKDIVYIDYSAKKIFPGPIIGLKDRKNYTNESVSRLNRVDIASIPLENSLVMGDRDAKKKVIVFDDPD